MPVYHMIKIDSESLKMLQKSGVYCFEESILTRTQVFVWQKAFSESHEAFENLPHASRSSISAKNIEKVKETVLKNHHVAIRELAGDLISLIDRIYTFWLRFLE